MLNKLRDWVLDARDLIQDALAVEEPSSAATSSLTLSDHLYPSFSERLLPYQYFDQDTNLFFNTDNAGLIYRVVPLTGANEQVAEQLDLVLRTKVSNDFTLQVILVKHNQVGREIDAFAQQFQSKDFENLAALGNNLHAFYTDAARTGFKTNGNHRPRLTHTECFIVVDKPKKGSERDMKAAFGQFQVPFEASLTAANIGFKRAGVEDFLSLIHFFLNNCPDTIIPTPVAYDERQLLKHQLLSRDFDLEVGRDGLLIHGENAEGTPFDSAVTVLTLDRLPNQFHLWECINNTSNIFHPEQSVPCNHIISVIYQVDEPLKAQGRANRKTRGLDKKAKSDYALLVAGTEEQARVWRTFRDDLSAQKTRAVKMLYNVILFSRPKDAARDTEATKSVFAYNGIKLAPATRLQLPYFLASMPFLFTAHLEHDFALPTMMWPISSWNATQYMPLLSDWTGVGRGVLLPTLREQFACIDPFSGAFGTNDNMAVTGTSGSGKSFFIQMLMLNVLFNGGDIFIIDIGGSYRKLCEALGGTYLEYSNLAMNPFTHVTDIVRELDDIIALFELLACPTSGATDDDRGTLREAILAAFANTGCQTRIDEVQQALLHLYELDKETYPSARILSKNMRRYCTTSEHGKAFNEPSRLSPDARIIVVDLKEIEDNVSIRAPVLLSVIAQFQRRMFNSDRNKQKMCIIDEAWSFFTGDAIATKFITKGFRTGRRHKASFVTITQGIADYYQFSEARAAWENSALKLIFLQEQDPLMKHQKEHETFSDQDITLLKAFPKAKKAGFSQVLLRSEGTSSVHRLFVDPYTRVLLSSDAKDYQGVLDYVNEGMSFSDAVSRVAASHEAQR